MHEMNHTARFIVLILTIICVSIILLQHYYFDCKKFIAVKLDVPVFEDLIVTDHNKYAVGHKKYDASYYDKESSLYDSLKKHLSTEDYNTQFEQKHAKSFLATESEVQNSLQAALAFKLAGRTEKAIKLFEHAAAIAPNNADVLNYYGEFLEQTHKDIITADELYFKALTFSPNHKDAFKNRKRTAQVVDQMDLKMFKRIDAKRDLLKEKFDTESFDTIKKQAYYLHIYHTVSIEGNTMTVNELRYLLETGRAVSGRSIVEHNEILGLELAMKYVKLLTRIDIIGIKEILGIHRRVMGHVDPLSSGVFRDQQVFVGSHIPPAPENISRLMLEYIEWLNSEEALNMHPVRYAALAHYKLVDIHPFTDGNGRTSRLIMNLILLRTGYPPVMIMKEHRQKYYEYLNTANQGDVRPFVRFIAKCTDDILDMYLIATDNRSIEGIAGVDLENFQNKIMTEDNQKYEL